MAELIYVFLPEALMPLERGERYEDPIDEALQTAGLGEVSGGGTQLGRPDGDGRQPIESCGVDVDTDEPEAARALLRDLLPSLDCGAGTRLRWEVGEDWREDRFDGRGWTLDQPQEHAA